jgi:lactoylglutathione lyase
MGGRDGDAAGGVQAGPASEEQDLDKPLFRKLDNILLQVSDLDAAVSFYSEGLGHPLLWRDRNAAGFALPETDAELVVHLQIGPETDILVEDVENAARRFVEAGGTIVEPPFDIAIGRCARVRDPFGNVLVILDLSKGRLATAEDGQVIGVAPDKNAPATSEAPPNATRA